MLERCGIDEVTPEVLGFVEMQTMKIGALMDQPRSLRIQQLQHERSKRKQVQEDAAKKREQEVRQLVLG